MPSSGWEQNNLEKIKKKIKMEIVSNQGLIPYISENGHYIDQGGKNISWWTNGFFSGILWQLFNESGDKIYKDDAELIELRLDEALDSFQGLHHDVGFMWLHTAVANYRLTKNEKSKVRGLHAATLLAGRYNLIGEYLRSWNQEKAGWVIIDSMMNLPLLYWATQETKDPRFSFMATRHAKTVQKYLVRPDGSVAHIAVFNENTGAFIENSAGQGYSSESSWTRGQAWAIYGFALAYRYSKDRTFLDTAKRIAYYFMTNISEYDYITPVDFRAPYQEKTKWDTSAGLCAACGLLEISKFLSNGTEKKLFEDVASKIIVNTEREHANWDLNKDGIIQNSSHSYHQEKETHVPIIYGDYFFIEAILRLLDKDFLIW